MPAKDYCRENALSNYDRLHLDWGILRETCHILEIFRCSLAEKEKGTAFMGEESKAIEISIKGNWLTCLNKLLKNYKNSGLFKVQRLCTLWRACPWKTP